MVAVFLLRPPEGNQYCKIQNLPANAKSLQRLARGESTQGVHMDSHEFRMAAVAKGIQVPDVISNAFGFLMISEKLKALLDEHVTGAIVEYTPFKLLNHKNRVAADPCFIANPIGTVDCADRSQSEGVETAMHPGELFSPRRITLVDSKVPTDRNLFRTSLVPAGVWVTKSLHDVLESAKLTARFVGSGDAI
jgi:hypothetical protein